MKSLMFLIPLFILAWFSPSIDLSITHYFYEESQFSNHPVFTFLYDYGERPAQIFASLGLLYICFSYLLNKGEKYRLHALYLFLTLFIGAFVINELTLKNNWGRPRPRNVIEFGGKEPFHPFYSPNFTQVNKSFPCGHCTAGYYFFTFAFLGRRLQRKNIYFLSLIFAIGFGSLIGLARIAQGGHFFTDVIFGALVMWITAWGLDRVIFSDERAYEATS